MVKSQEASPASSHSLEATSTVVESPKVSAAVANSFKASTTVAVSVKALTAAGDTLKVGHTNHLTPKEANEESKAVTKENKVSGDSGQTRVPAATTASLSYISDSFTASSMLSPVYSSVIPSTGTYSSVILASSPIFSVLPASSGLPPGGISV